MPVSHGDVGCGAVRGRGRVRARNQNRRHARGVRAGDVGVNSIADKPDVARRHAEALAILERLTDKGPGSGPRDLAWRAAALGHLGRLEEVRRTAQDFLVAMRSAWRGDPAAGPADYADWVIDHSYLCRPEDEAHLREGLRLARLPV